MWPSVLTGDWDILNIWAVNSANTSGGGGQNLKNGRTNPASQIPLRYNVISIARSVLGTPENDGIHRTISVEIGQSEVCGCGRLVKETRFKFSWSLRLFVICVLLTTMHYFWNVILINVRVEIGWINRISPNKGNDVDGQGKWWYPLNARMKGVARTSENKPDRRLLAGLDVLVWSTSESYGC